MFLIKKRELVIEFNKKLNIFAIFAEIRSEIHAKTIHHQVM